MEFSVFIGVDQTGRKLRTGKPAPLPVCVLIQTGGQAHLWAGDPDGRPLFLSSCSSEALALLLQKLKLPSSLASMPVALVLDCVFGLPEPVRKGTGLPAHPWECLALAASKRFEPLGFGREAASCFFSALWPETSIPQRTIEKVSGSNSVFQKHPFQKNIQTGTFRLWKEIGSGFDPACCAFWPWESPWEKESASALLKKNRSASFWFFEGYPSWFWKHEFGFPHRQPKALSKKLSSLGITLVGGQVLSDSADHADAAVLAAGALLLQNQKRLWEPFSGFGAAQVAEEGWILGVRPEEKRAN